MKKKNGVYNIVMSCRDEFTNQTGVRLVKVQAHTKRAARKLALDLIWSCDPWMIKAMGIDGQDHVAPVELIYVGPSSKHDLPSRVWTPEELEDGNREELVKEPEPFSIATSAYHEAGHAVLAHELGWDVTEVEVYPTRRIQDQFSEGGVCHYMMPFNRDDEDELLVLMAGPVAESIHKNNEFSIAGMLGLGSEVLGGSGDHDSASALASQMHFGAGDVLTHRHHRMVETYLTYMAQRVRVQYLDPHWNTIDRLAKTLIEKKKISGLEVVALLDFSEAKAAA